MFTREQEIEEFLDEYKRSRVVVETTVRATLNKVIKFEDKFQKPFYEFSEEEAIKVFASFHAISIVSLQNANLLIKHASRWIIDKKKLNVKSVYEDINKDQLQSCVDIQKKESLIFTREDLKEIQNELLNYTDKCILFLLFEGVGGYLLKDLMFMEKKQISRNDLKIYFKTGKVIDITPEDYEVLRNGFNEDELVTYGYTHRVERVINLGLYKPRPNSLSDNANINNPDDVMRRYRFVQRRLDLIAKDLDITLTPSGLHTSGLLHYLKQGVNESGMSFKEYVKTAEAKKIAQRYEIMSELYFITLTEKFQKYFD